MDEGLTGVGWIGLGRMGGAMAAHLLTAGHRVVGTDPDRAVLERLVAAGGETAPTTEALLAALPSPRVLWLMVPAGRPVSELLEALLPHIGAGDVLVDGGNGDWRQDARHARELEQRGASLCDVGTSGGVAGAQTGWCLMAGGSEQTVARVAALFDALARPHGGWEHVGPVGAGHYVKMVHNAVEYGLMQAYAEGHALLARSERFDIDTAAVTRLWTRGSVVRSWLLELAAAALERDPALSDFSSQVRDSGEGRWAQEEALAQATPTPVLAAALAARFASRDGGQAHLRLLTALRHGFGGHSPH